MDRESMDRESSDRVYVGIDVSKASLDVHVLRSGEHWSCGTDEASLDELASRLCGLSPWAVVLEATHTCMTIRGVKKPGSVMVTSAMLGQFRTDARSRSEVMSLING